MTLADAAHNEVADSLFEAPEVAHISRLTAVETVRARIILAIDHQLLAAGAKLPHNKTLAAGFEVSEITVRRALESLVTDGFLVRRAGRHGGTYIADNRPASDALKEVQAFRADRTQISHLINLRSLTETAIVIAAAARITAQQCDELETLIQQSRDATTWEEHHIPDSKFHRLIAEISGLPEVSEYLQIYTQLTRYFVPYPQDKLEHGREEHAALVSAFRARDTLAAVAVTRKHIDMLRHEMFPALKAPTGNSAAPAKQ